MERGKFSHKRAYKAISSYVIIAIVVIAVVAMAAVLLLYKPSATHHHTTTTSTTTTSGAIIVFVAGAYEAIFKYLASQFEKQTGITVDVVPGGSFGLAAQIAKGEPVSVFVPVAYIQAVELEGNRNPGWAIAFISDQMAIIYSNHTTQLPYWNELYSNYTMAMKTNETKYWYNFFYLLVTKFSLGISNPNSDPEGLYAYLILEMAGKLYANGNTSYFIDLANQYHNVLSAPTTADYVPDLKAGTLDFAFSYVSYAISQGFEYLKLPPWLSFGYYPNETKWYSQFYYIITVNGQKLTIHGNPVYLYITIPINATNEQEAIEFVEFIVNHVQELSKFGVIPITHPLLFYQNKDDVPSQILNLLNEGVLTYGGNFSQI